MIRTGVIIAQVRRIVGEVLKDYIQRIYNSIPSDLKVEYKVAFDVYRMRATVYTETDMAAYIEFGTGDFASRYLGSKPQEMKDDAMLFFKTGKGTMKESPYLFPAFYRYKDEILRTIDRKVQIYFNSLVL